jgi:hypothetical protein
MTSSDSKIQKAQASFQALSSVASSLNKASNELAGVVSVLDEALKKLNVGLTVWVTVRSRSDEPQDYDDDQIGYDKINGKWGIALRHIWGNYDFDRHNQDGPWLFNDAPRELRLQCLEKIPELIDALNKEAVATTKKVYESTLIVRELTLAIEKTTGEQGSSSKGSK